MRHKLSNVMLAAVLAVLLLPVSLLGQANLSGTVVDEAGGPLENAKVWIQTAAPKKGKGYL